jgi:hypothetical protein
VIHTTLRSTLMAAGLVLGFAACSSGGPGDGGTTTGSVTGGTTTGGSSSAASSSSGTTTASSSTSGASSSGSGTTGTGTTSSGTTGTGTTSGTTTGPGGNNGSVVSLRFANFAPNVAGAVDFCYLNGDDTDAGWQGPVLTLNGQPNGVSYPTISGYDQVNGPVQLSEMKVLQLPITNVANACIDAGAMPGVGISQAFSQQPIGANKSATIALEGYSGGSATYKLVVDGYLDEPQPSSTKFRFVNASPQNYTFDFGLGVGGAFSPLLQTVAFATFGSGSALDSAGYQPFVSDGGVYVFDVQQSGTHTDTLAFQGVTMADPTSTSYPSGYSFFFGTDVSGANPWGFFCNDIASFGTYTACYFPDGGLFVPDAGH